MDPVSSRGGSPGTLRRPNSTIALDFMHARIATHAPLLRWPALAAAAGLWILGSADASRVMAQDIEPPPWGPCSQDERTGIVLEGSVVDRATGSPLPGATVRVQAGPDEMTSLGAVSTEASGSFAACGSAGVNTVHLVATYGGRENDPRPVTPPETGVRLAVDLGRPAFLLLSVVEEETGSPVVGASIELSPIRLAGVSDSSGRLALPRVPPFRYEVRVRHVAYEPLDDTLRVRAGGRAELRVPLSTRVHALAPLRVTVTGRDPFLVRRGFYDRRNRLEDGYFAVGEEVRPYRLLSTLFDFKRELIIRFRGPKVVLVDGRPMRTRGYLRLDEIPMHRVRGVEAFRCAQAPQEYLRYVPSLDCSMILLWTR